VIWRIRARSVFGRFRSDGRRYRHDPLWLSWIDDPSAQPPRLAFAISRAVGPAVTRNRLRRRLRAALHDVTRSEGDLPAGWYLLGVAPGGAAASFAALHAATEHLCRQVRADGAR
jgi:ribonuclease P protein component